MDAVARWLEGLGLGQHVALFGEHAIDFEVLPELTEADLEKLGLPLGHRKKLLRAIAALATEPALPTEEGGSPPDLAIQAAERRQLTVMFVDLVGSTALSARLDPEELGGLMRAYQNAVVGEVARLEGHIAKFMGDGVLAYFGWPRAHEDEAERAVRAGLAIRDAVGRLAAPEPLAARIGIATGVVVVGDLIGEGASREETVVGETPNLAARLQALAAPGSIVVAESTRRLLAGLFELEDLGGHGLKGFEKPVPAFRVLGEGAAEGRFEARHGAGTLPLVGREQELALLLERWALTKAGEGQAVLLSGEPGIGKSRVVLALRERLRDEPRTTLRCFCSPYHTNSALYPVLAQLERAAGFARDDPPAARLARLDALLAQAVSDPSEATLLIAELLGIPIEDRQLPELTPQQRRSRTFQALLAQLEGLAAQRPVLMLLEDAHWLDPTSMELFGLIVDRIQHLPVLLLVTHRPELDAPWRGYPHVTILTLNRLARAQAQAMVAHLTGGRALPGEVLEPILAKTEGVPLFVEELTRAVLESGLVRDVEHGYALCGPLPPLAIPVTLQDSLMARLDRLASAKNVAQIGACIGREFEHELLAAVADMPAARLEAALSELVRGELLFRRGTPPEATYIFKHALVQDTAYHSLLKNKRQEIHRNIARTLEERFPQATDIQPELMAHHFTEAGLAERAIAYWHRAGQRATGRSANWEAVGHLTKGLDILRKTPATRDRTRQELTLQIALGAPLQALKGQAAPEAAEAFRRARELCEQLGDTRRLSMVLHGLHAFHIVRGELPAAMALAKECYHIARDEEDGALLAAALFVLGCVSFHVAKLTSAQDKFEKAVHLYDPSPRAPRVLPAGVDLGVFGKSYLSHAVWYLGYPDRAVAWSRAAAADAAECSHFFSQAVAAAYAAMLMQFLGDARAAKQQADAAIALCTEHKFAYYLAWARVIRGWALAREGREDEGILEMREGLAALRATDAGLRRPYYLGILAETLGAAGRIEEASDLVASALAVAAEHGEQFFSAELHRIEGELLARRSRPEASEIALHQAIAIARSHKARSLELRAATSLARLWASQGHRGPARDLLAPIYTWFTEGFDSADLNDAKALLDQLAQ